MRLRLLSLKIFLFVVAALSLTASRAAAQTQCTGLCLQQVTCPAGQTTSISGIVYAPNGTDPLPNVTVYVPNASVDGFTPGVSCPVVGAAPSGSPLVGAVTAVDGSFTIGNMPVGANIPLVIVTGRWRVQTTVSTTSCGNTPLPASQTHLPQNQSQGDIPKFAISTGNSDQVECVLRKVGVADTEFTNPGGGGRIEMYQSQAKPAGSPGAIIDNTTPTADVLLGNAATLNQYDVLMLPCEGGEYIKPAQELANLVDFANAGGRVYSSHYSYTWMFNNPPFNSVVNWSPNLATSINPDPGGATVNTGFSDGLTLATWLQEVGASTTPGQITVSTLRQDFTTVNSPTQTWLTLNNTARNNPVMQFVFDTPVGTKINQCGRVLFNEYHVENPPSSPAGKAFPTECTTGSALTPQEKLLEFSLFELTNDGGAATLTPASADFGTQPIGFASPAQTFTWTNNSSFTAAVTVLTASGDFNILSSNCSSVVAGASCQIVVNFDPTAIGARTGTLTVGSSGSTLLAQLTGMGIPDLSLSFASLTFPSIDVGASSTQSLIVTNSASGAVPVPALTTTGDFSTKSNCGNTLAALSSCVVNVTFTPTTTGPRTGTLGVNSTLAAYTGATTALSGNGIDFTLVNAPTSGTVIAGYNTSFQITSTPLAGFAAPITISCSTNAPASVCTPATSSVTLSGVMTTNVSITTTSEYTVIGYGGIGGDNTVLWLIAMGSGAMLLWSRRRDMRGALRAGLLLMLVMVGGLSMSGCSGKLPAKNASYTPATGSGTNGSNGTNGGSNGGYTYTITESDGFLVHSATYSLAVTVK